jgi:hypothetical protein
MHRWKPGAPSYLYEAVSHEGLSSWWDNVMLYNLSNVDFPAIHFAGMLLYYIMVCYLLYLVCYLLYDGMLLYYIMVCYYIMLSIISGMLSIILYIMALYDGKLSIILYLLWYLMFIICYGI